MEITVEEDVMIDIDASVSCKSASNTVEISVQRDTEMLYTYVSGNVVKLGSGIAPPYPIPHLLVNNIVSFDPHNIYHLLYSTLQDPTLCSRLSVKIASEAERVPGPLYISLHVTLTPKRFLGADCITTDEEEDDETTCAICLEEKPELFILPNCPHAFHHDCINEWLIKSNTCPLCRTVVLDHDDDDHPYNSETES